MTHLHTYLAPQVCRLRAGSVVADSGSVVTHLKFRHALQPHGRSALDKSHLVKTKKKTGLSHLLKTPLSHLLSGQLTSKTLELRLTPKPRACTSDRQTSAISTRTPQSAIVTPTKARARLLHALQESTRCHASCTHIASCVPFQRGSTSDATRQVSHVKSLESQDKPRVPINSLMGWLRLVASIKL